MFKRQNLPFMCLMSFSLGIIAGLGAWAFRMFIGPVHNMTPENNPINDLLREMHAADAKFTLVTGAPGTPMPNEIIGVVTEHEVSESAMGEAN